MDGKLRRHPRAQRKVTRPQVHVLIGIRHQVVKFALLWVLAVNNDFMRGVHVGELVKPRRQISLDAYTRARRRRALREEG